MGHREVGVAALVWPPGCGVGAGQPTSSAVTKNETKLARTSSDMGCPIVTFRAS